MHAFLAIVAAMAKKMMRSILKHEQDKEEAFESIDGYWTIQHDQCELNIEWLA